MFALLLHVLRVARECPLLAHRPLAAFLATHGPVRQSLARILHRDFPALVEIALDRTLPDRLLSIRWERRSRKQRGLNAARGARTPATEQELAAALAHFDLVVQLIAVEEMTRIAKAADGQLLVELLAAIFSHKPGMTSVYLHALFTFASIAIALLLLLLLLLPLPPDILDHAIRICIGDWFASRVPSSRGWTITKRALTTDLLSAMPQ
jgi:hypothetical protein